MVCGCLFSMPVWANGAFVWIEEIAVQPWEINAKAKLDTRALISSMHAEDIEHFKRDGKEWLRFTANLLIQIKAVPGLPGDISPVFNLRTG